MEVKFESTIQYVLYS